MNLQPAKQSTTRRPTWRYALMSALIVALATGACVLAGVMAASKPKRFDLTATRQHSLSERTLGVIRSLDAPHEIIVAADVPTLAPVVWQRVLDVLDEFEHASPEIGVTIIDSSSPASVVELRALLERLAAMYAEPLARSVKALQDGVTAATQIAQGSSELSNALISASDAIDPSLSQRQQLVDLAAVARLHASEFVRAGNAAQQALDARLAGSAVPLVDEARAALTEPLAAVADEFDALAQSLMQFADALRQQALAGADAVRAAAQQAQTLRDDSARAADALARLPMLQLLPIARALASTNAVIVASPTSATAIRFDSLVPEQALINEMGGATADVRFIGEELIATALGALSRTDQPVVVLTHAGGERLLDSSGNPADRRGPFQARALVDRLRLRGMMVLEWAVALDAEAPTIAHLDEIGERPIVWAVIGSAALGAESAANLPMLQRAVSELLGAGEAVLLSTAPSTLPGLGEPDPLVQPLEAFGITVDTGRPLLRRVPRTGGATISPSVVVLDGADEQPIGRAADGLSTLLPWACSMTVSNPSGASAWPVLTLSPSENIWGESQWIEFWSMPQSQRDRLLNPPGPTPERDIIGGPWTVAAAAERVHPTGDGSQRVVVVGGLGWFFDIYTTGSMTVDGRTVQTSPGNIELLEASVHWLAGQDELVGSSARAAEVARIGTMAPRQLTLLRWSLVVLLPSLVLATGVTMRLWRG